MKSFALKPQSLIRTDSLYLFMMPTSPEVWKPASKTGAEEEGIKRMKESFDPGDVCMVLGGLPGDRSSPLRGARLVAMQH